MPRTPSKAMAPRLASPSRLEPRSTRRGVKPRPPGHFTFLFKLCWLHSRRRHLAHVASEVGFGDWLAP